MRSTTGDSQRLATQRSNERYQVASFGLRRGAAMPHSGAGSRARRVACYAELPRITILGTSVNKIVPGRAKTARNVSGGLRPWPRPLTCCRRGRYVAVEAEEIVRVVAVLELHQTLEVLR